MMHVDHNYGNCQHLPRTSRTKEGRHLPTAAFTAFNLAGLLLATSTSLLLLVNKAISSSSWNFQPNSSADYKALQSAAGCSSAAMVLIDRSDIHCCYPFNIAFVICPSRSGRHTGGHVLNVCPCIMKEHHVPDLIYWEYGMM
jgi:hypothetical protein